MAQSVAHLIGSEEVSGSIPDVSTRGNPIKEGFRAFFYFGATLDEILSRKPGTFEFMRLINTARALKDTN